LEKIPKKIMVDSNDPSSLASFPFSEEASGHFPNHGIHVFIGETKVSFYLVAINSSYKVESLLEILLMLSNTKVRYNRGVFSNFPYHTRSLIITYIDPPLLTMFKLVSPSSPMGWGSKITNLEFLWQSRSSHFSRSYRQYLVV
jgi:hypothetical protein